MPLQNIYPQEWKSCLETITPDSPYMLLENGEYATLPENLNFIFEVDDLENELPENIVEQVCFCFFLALSHPHLLHKLYYGCMWQG